MLKHAIVLSLCILNSISIQSVPNELIAQQQLEAKKKEKKKEMYELLKSIYYWRDVFKNVKSKKEQAYEVLAALYIGAQLLQEDARNLKCDDNTEYRLLSNAMKDLEDRGIIETEESRMQVKETPLSPELAETPQVSRKQSPSSSPLQSFFNWFRSTPSEQ